MRYENTHRRAVVKHLLQRYELELTALAVGMLLGLILTS